MNRREALQLIPVLPAAMAGTVRANAAPSSDSIAQSRKVLAEAFAADESFRHCYVANIACAIYDSQKAWAVCPNLNEIGGCNSLADYIVTLIFETGIE